MTALLAALALAGGALPALTEDDAIRIVQQAMRQLDPVPQRCLLYDTEGRSARSFAIAVRENHDAGCGGDPDISPVIERFRVRRLQLRLSRWDAASDTYRRCRLERGKPPAC